MKRHGTVIGRLLALLALLALFAVYYFERKTNMPGPLTETRLVVVPKGASSRSVAESLMREEVIDSPLAFMLAGRLTGLDKQLRAGEYQFNPNVSIKDVIRKMTKGEVYYHRITLPEGYPTGKLLFLIASEPNLSGDVTLDVKEGELLPETYSFELGTPKDEIIRQARKAMRQTREAAWRNRSPDLPVKDINQLVVLASIVEKETAVASERGLVASVFVNRLRKGMKLQTDPTVIYAITEGMHDLGRSLSKKDLRIDSPYNTYKYYGLPPAPISNPSKESIWAAANPEYSEYLYFVADGRGGHNFSKSLNEHNTHVKSWVSDLRAKRRAGK